MEAATHTPPKLLFVNLVSTDELEVQFNPTQLQEQIEANWSHQTVPGQSHEPLQFVNTANFKLDIELFFRATKKAELEAMHRARRQILSWAYPRDIAGDVVGGGAPRILVYWPGMLSLTCVVTNVGITHNRFNRNARSVEYTCRLQLEEIRDTRLHFDEVAEDNVLRFGDGIGLEEGG
jgi:hypothetical protein